MWPAENNAKLLLSSVSIDYRGGTSENDDLNWHRLCHNNIDRSPKHTDAIDTDCLPGHRTDIIDLITQKCMDNPVVLETGDCYDLSTLQKTPREPYTNLPWEETSWALPNLTFRNKDTFQNFCKSNRWRGARMDVTEMAISSCEIDNAVMEEFCKTIKVGALPNLTILNLGENKIDDAGIKAFAAVCGAMANLTKLHLYENQITDDGFFVLMPLIQEKLAGLTEFSIGSGVTDKGMEKFASILGTGAIPQLQLLALDRNQIGDSGMQALAATCGNRAMANLTQLFLANNVIGDIGMRAFAAVCGSGAITNLTKLHLLNNKITDNGFFVLMPLLQKDGKLAGLTEFSIGSSVSDMGMNEFARILDSGAIPKLKRLDLGENQIGSKGMIAFAAAIRSGALSRLEVLSLGTNQIGDTGLAALASACGSGALLQLIELDLQQNFIGDGGTAALLTALENGALPQLEDLRLYPSLEASRSREGAG